MAIHEYETILDRLISILARLNNGEALSVKELAKDFNVSDRTIQRDFNERLVLHYPIYQEGKKWKMQDGFKLEKHSSVEDTVVLDIVQRLVEGAGTTFAAKANKLLSKIKNESLNPIYTKLDMEDIGDKLQEIQKLELAIKEKKQINCFYTPLDQPTVQIDLKPLKIANYEGYWYLIGLDSRNDILKKYYLKSIKQIKILDTTFESNKKLDKLLDNSISVWFKEEVEPYRVTLHVSSKVAEYFTRKPISKSQFTESIHEDGSMIVSVEITDDMEIIPFVKYWIPYIKVIDPKNIEETIRNDLELYLSEI